jgi:hypothetical protein
MRPRAADLDFITVGAPQMAGAPESFYVRLEKSGYNRYWEYILRQPEPQVKKCFTEEQ